eukprot:364930-Chlamydomonas_euryale.AAC.20
MLLAAPTPSSSRYAAVVGSMHACVRCSRLKQLVGFGGVACRAAAPDCHGTHLACHHATRRSDVVQVKEVPRWGGYVVNLLHYEDAARLAFAVLRGDGEGPFKGQAFIGCDGVPVTFADMMAACNASGVPELRGEVNFTLPEDQASKGKRVFNDGTRARLGGWTPTYGSFAEFMAAGARDCYNS